MHRNAKLESSDSTPSFTDVVSALKTISQSTNRNDMRRIVGIVFYLRADVGYVNHDAVLASAMQEALISSYNCAFVYTRPGEENSLLNIFNSEAVKETTLLFFRTIKDSLSNSMAPMRTTEPSGEMLLGPLADNALQRLRTARM